MKANVVQFPSKTLQQYFAQSDTPAAGSPVGVEMQRLLRKNPRLTFAEAREQASGLSADDAANLSSAPGAWTDGEQDAFAQVMKAGRLTRMPAIRLYRRCGSNLEKALRLAVGYNPLSPVQTATYEKTKATRLASLVKARAAVALNRRIQQTESPLPRFAATLAPAT